MKDSTDEILTESKIIHVDMNSKSSNEDGSNLNPYKSFRSAYDAAGEGDTISISLGVYKGPENLFFSMENKGKVTVQASGENVIFDGDGGYYTTDMYGRDVNPSILTILDEGIVIDGITFKNGHVDGDGAAINLISNDCTLKNCKFISNSADGKSGAVYVYNNEWDGDYWGCNETIINCQFEHNSAYEGGAIYWSGNKGYVDNTNFNNNTAGNGGKGGALLIYGSENIVDNCIFNKNIIQSGPGSAVYVLGHYCYFNNSTFTENNYKWSSTGVLYWNGGAGYVNNCKFDSNAVEEECGAIYWNGDDGIVNNSNFDNNNARRVSAVGLYGNNIKVINSVFNKNTARYEYGAVYCEGNNNTLEYDTFTNNEVDGEGAAIYWFSESGTIKYCKSYTKDPSKGNDLYLNWEDITLIEYPVTMDSKDISTFYGSSEKYLVTLTKSGEPIAYANVNININNKNYNIKTNSSGTASYKLNLPVGNYIVTAECDGVKDSSNVLIKSTITADDCIGEYLNSKVSSTFLTTDGKALSGKQVTFKVNGKDCTAKTDSKGVATVNVDLSVGTYTVTAINPVNKEEKEFKLTINKAGSLINLVSSQNAGVITLTASLTPDSATGDVVFTIDGKNYSAGVKNGVASVSLKDLEAGNYTATAVYDGDNNLKSSASSTVTFEVLDVYPILTVKDITKTYGASNKLLINLVDNKGNAIANVNIDVVLNGVTKSLTTDSKGQASMAVGVAPGTYDAIVSYGDTKATAKVIVKKATPKFTASKKTYKVKTKTKKYTVTLKVNSKALKKVKVTIKVNGKTYSAKTNSKGKATFKITKLTKKGTFKAKINYSGSKYYNKATKTVKLTIKK